MSSIIRIHRVPKLLCCLFFLGLVAYVLIGLLSGSNTLQDKYNYKLQIMQKLIRSNANADQCMMPNLPVHSPEMMAFTHDEPPINCEKAGPDWVECNLAVCAVKKTIVIAHGTITCDYSEILRKDDYSVRYRDAVRTTQNYTLKASDFVHVKCWNDAHAGWTGIVFGLREYKRPLSNPGSGSHVKSADQQSPPVLNVLMFGLDSLSRNSVMRKLPKTYAYLTEKLAADVLTGYNIVGDGTPQALIPLLTGQTELELPEARRRMPNSHTVDAFPFIWKEFERAGYVTAFNEDLPKVGTFTYRLNGFGSQPTAHYQRTYYLAIESILRSQQRLCIGQHPRHQIMLNYTRQFMSSYGDQPHFVFSFHGELSHDSINLVGVADDDLVRWLSDLHESGLLRNTLLITMADHGNRFAEVRNTLQGKLEERLPFFSFAFPEWFKQRHEAAYRVFRANLDRLVTPFDVHATLADLIRMQTGQAAPTSTDSSGRARSLFTPIPADRTCADAFIEPHWCVCLRWYPIADLESETVRRLSRSVVDAINRFTAVDDKCARLYVHKVTWAAKLSPHDNLLRFRRTKDGDGFLADLADQAMNVSSEMYQVKLIVRPGDSIFEASVSYNPQRDEYLVEVPHISRINKYGNQAACIMESNPELRKFCNCKARGDD